MNSDEIRQKFLNFFRKRGHTIVPSSSLIPDDPSVLFTTAGMQQFKPYYTGELNPETVIHPSIGKPVGKNAASIQKCIRTSDIDEVGDESHLIFFEMLGNFSFGHRPGEASGPEGGYFKKEAIKYAHEFITKEMELKIDYVSVFGGGGGLAADTDSEKIWKEIDKNIIIKKFGKADNFWGPTGDEGPCGPTTEIYVKNVDGKSVEVWNIVFNQYYCKKAAGPEGLWPGEVSGPVGLSPGGDKTLEPLKTPGIDTGMGLERLAMVVQNKPTIFETDLFEQIIQELEKQSQKSYQKNARIFRIIADHLKASAFIISEGTMPSNVERGYVLRRLLRRVIRCGKLLSLENKFYISIVKVIVEIYKEIYPEIKNKETEILTVIQNEEEKFNKTLQKGLDYLNKIITKIEWRGEKYNYEDLGKAAFDLYQSYGFPLELTIEELKGHKFLKILDKSIILNEKLLKENFEKELKEHQKISRAGAEKKFGGHGLVLDTGELKAASEEEVKKATELHTATHMLQAALRKILGESIKQMGSDITAERLRFDFNFTRKLTPEELKKIEDLVNQKINESLVVEKKEMPYAQAIKEGALAFFKGKYPQIVNVYTIYNPKTKEVFSKEVCGGPHVKNTSEVGKFKIIKEESAAAGVRRIRAAVE